MSYVKALISLPAATVSLQNAAPELFYGAHTGAFKARTVVAGVILGNYEPAG